MQRRENESAFRLREVGGLRKRRRGAELLHDRHRSYTELWGLFFTSFRLPRRRRRSARNYRREEHKRETVFKYAVYVRPFLFFCSYAVSIILRHSLRGFKPQCGKLRAVHGCVIVICKSMSLYKALSSNKVLRTNETLRRTERHTNSELRGASRIESRSPRAIKYR